MDIQAMQSMDWLFKKERIYLLAQFWQQRATLAEKEVSALKEQLASGNHGLQGKAPSADMEPPSLEHEIAAKDKEIAQLLEDVQRLQANLSKLQETSAAQVSRLEEQLEHRRQHIARLEARLDQQRDYEDLKREVSMLRAMDLPLSADKPLELLMLERTKALQTAEVKTPDVSSDAPPPPASSPARTSPPVPCVGAAASPSLVNSSGSAPSVASPVGGAAPTDAPGNHLQQQLLNGGNPPPRTPPEEGVAIPPPPPPPVSTPGAAGTPLYFRGSGGGDDNMKSPFRFDDPRSPFRFGDDGAVGRLGESLIPKGDPMEARLQEMLRYNMDKYATQNLDTLHISRRVRELLSVNNIGQRLFAKYVLGLSQGTVSELLSKPKPWDKLTEKGRDSYRKMHAWACDDNAVMLLKSLIPKKGKDTGIPPFGRGDPDNMTEERIAHILSEASQMMKGQVEDSHSNDSKSPNHAQEKVVRIYQEELAKLMGRRMDDRPRDHFPSLLFPHFFPGGGGGSGPMDRTQEEIRMALDAYHRELAKLNSACPSTAGLLALQQQAALTQQQQQHQQQQVAQMNGVAQDLSLPKQEPRKDKLANGELPDPDKKEVLESVADVLRHAGSAFSLVRPKLEPGMGQPSQPSTGSSTAGSPLSNSILPPAMTPADEFVGSAAASPLQRMASITNSLISQPSTPSHHSPSQRPLKAVLPPITQQQFDMYNNLNTEEIVKKVKESLSQYSISQRLFGESVLGLSQGSVSDLLARPKPWHMLTQKGREPFIRMKMFLEDDNAVHKLVASQYKIAPEKLMRTGSYAGGPPCTSLTKPQPTQPKMLPTEPPKGHELGPSMQMHPQPPPTSVPQPPPPPLLVTPPGHMAGLAASDMKKSHMHPSHHAQPNALRALQQHMAPSVYEMAALTQDLDTQTITTKIKEALLANNIGQKIFGEAVLGLSQGSVSELLSKPKPWHMLSIKGREPFIRMQLWLSDAHNIDRLQALKNERREANKRRRSSGPGGHHMGGGGGGGADNSSDTSSNDTSEFYHSPSPGPGPPSAKKQRVLFSEEQKEALRLAFALDSYPNMATIEFLGAELALSSRTITNWFHNHRMRLKQQVPHGVSPEGAPQGNREASGGQQTFDPVQFRLLLNQRLLELQKERLGLGSVPLPYPPYFTANNNHLAALISRGLLPSADCDIAGSLSNAVKEQFSGLDLSMGGLKREPDFEDEEDVESNLGSEDSNLSSGSLRETAVKKESATILTPVRTSRRKPAAPQWVNPEWQEVTGPTEEGKDKRGDQEVIINGVCVMQTDDYGMKLTKDEETVRVEPTPVLDRYEDDDDDQCSEASSDGDAGNTDVVPTDCLRPRGASVEGELNDEPERRSAKSEPRSPQHHVGDDGDVMAEPRLVKQEEESRDSNEDERVKDWDSGNCDREHSSDVLEKIQKRIKTEEQDGRWEY